LGDPVTGPVRPAQIFVAALGASNYTYAEARWSQSLADWIGCHGKCKNSGRSGRHLVAGSGSQPAMKDGGSDDGDAMSAPGRPSHSLTLAHASIGDFVDASLSARCRHRTIAVIPPMVADYASAVVSHVTTQLQALAQEIFGRHLLKIETPEGDVLRVMGETHQLLIRLRRSAMPQQRPDMLDRAWAACNGRMSRRSGPERPNSICSIGRMRIERWNQSRIWRTGSFVAARTRFGRAASPSLITITL
jgi:hypothetical protein